MAITILNDSNFEKEIKVEGTVVVDFFATWCGPCKMQSPIIDALSEEMTDVKFCKLDVDEAPETARQFGIMSIPTIMVIKDGEVSYQQPGLHQKEQLKDLL